MYSLPRQRTKKPITPVPYEPPTSHLHMYEEIPTLPEIDIGEFEDIAVERLRLLHIIERASKCGLKIDSTDWQQYIKENVQTARLCTYYRFFGLFGGKNEKQSKRNDHIAHFILMLAFCKSAELRERFAEQEVQLYRLKYACLGEEEKMVICNKYKTISKLEKLMIKEELYDCNLSIVDVDVTDFYQVPFYYANDSVSERNVYMHNGIVYLPAFQLSEYLGYVYKEKLKKNLLNMCNCLEAVESDERIKNVLENLAINTPILYNNDLNLKNLNVYAENNFPICMLHLHKQLHVNKHLKHMARVQYGRFLKEAGFSCDDVILLFRENFCKKMDEKKFLKKYTYSIKYMYGLAGRKIEQNAYDCRKIIESTVGCGSEHGCPYKHWDQGHLKDILLQKGLALPGTINNSNNFSLVFFLIVFQISRI